MNPPSEKSRPVAVAGAKLAARDRDEVEQPPEPEAAEGDELEDPGADLARVKPVGAEHAERNAESEGDGPGFLGRGIHSTEVTTPGAVVQFGASEFRNGV